MFTEIKDASEVKPKAKAKGKCEPKTKENPEPKWPTLEAALAAGEKCPKCIARIAGYKGCRACMGEWFEEIRQKGVKK